MTTRWTPKIDSRNTGCSLEKYIEQVELCRKAIELCFPDEYHDHPVVIAAADSQMMQPGTLAYDWCAAQAALGVC